MTTDKATPAVQVGVDEWADLCINDSGQVYWNTSAPLCDMPLGRYYAAPTATQPEPAPDTERAGVVNRWITQTTFYDPDDAVNPNKGNCGEAATASLLGVPLPPKFGASGKAGDYWCDFDNFIESHGFIAMVMEGTARHEGMYLASGPSGRGTSHMVVMRDGQMIHDPHPSREGIASVARIYILVPADPAAMLTSAPREVVVDEAMVERVAAAIYSVMPYDELIGIKPRWVERGNSLKQGEARIIARAALRPTNDGEPTIKMVAGRPMQIWTAKPTNDEEVT